MRPTLQIADPSNSNPHVFALGDVANTDGPRMARAARVQADIVTRNLLALINKQEPPAVYTPQVYEGVIK